MTILTCLGDSITDCDHCFSDNFLGNGYVKILSDHFLSDGIDCQVRNHGIDGFTVRRLLQRVKQNPGLISEIITILIGINDIGMMMNTCRTEEQQHTMQYSFQTHYEELLTILTKSTSRIILMEPFLFPCPAFYQAWLPLRHSMAENIQKLARQFQLPSDRRQSPGIAGIFYYIHRFSGIMTLSERRCFFMLTKNANKKREQMMMFSMDDMVPQNHMLRLIDKVINWNFIYDLVEEKYCLDNGRPSMDPVMLIKIPFIQYLYGIKSMRQTIKEIEVNVAYRWFLGLDIPDPVPHFSTFGKNYTRRFKDTDLFKDSGRLHEIQTCKYRSDFC